MSWDAHNLEGHILAQTYQLERLLFTGGMGAVYQARHLRTQGPCAAKVLHHGSVSNTELFERFQDEAHIIATLRHPNIVQVTDLDMDPRGPQGIPFLIMELLDGEDLGELLSRQGQMPLEEVLLVAAQAGSALQAAHSQGVVHRDIKPHNIFLLNQDPDELAPRLVKVLDFGLSKISRPASRATKDQMVLGTPRYLAPEAAKGENSQIDGRTDQFSLAVILYRALSGRPPFDATEMAEVLRQVVYDQPPPLGQLVPGLPGHVVQAIGQAMSKRKEDRFPTMRDFVMALLGRARHGSLEGRRAAPLPASGDLAPIPTVVTSSYASGMVPVLAWPPPGALPLPLGPLASGMMPVVPRMVLAADAPTGTRPAPPTPQFSWRRVLTAAMCGALLTSPVLYLGALHSLPGWPGAGTAARRGEAPDNGVNGTGAQALRGLALVAEDLDAERFSAAAARAQAVLALPGLQRDLRELALSRKAQAERELAAAGAYQRFSAAAGQRRLDEALLALRELPAESVFRRRAEAAHEQVIQLFAEQRLQDAEWSRKTGLCVLSQRQVQAVLRVAPLHPVARAALFRECQGEEEQRPRAEETDLAPEVPEHGGPGPGSAEGVLPLGLDRPIEAPSPGEGGSRDPGRQQESLAGKVEFGHRPRPYPPLRLGEEQGGAVKPIFDPGPVLDEAEQAWVAGRQRQAIEQGHLVLRDGPQEARRAWRVIGVAACELGTLPLFGLAYGHLDRTGREWLAQSCAALGGVPAAGTRPAAVAVLPSGLAPPGMLPAQSLTATK